MYTYSYMRSDTKERKNFDSLDAAMKQAMADAEYDDAKPIAIISADGTEVYDARTIREYSFAHYYPDSNE